jgi:hypothetical protein
VRSIAGWAVGLYHLVQHHTTGPHRHHTFTFCLLSPTCFFAYQLHVQIEYRATPPGGFALHGSIDPLRFDRYVFPITTRDSAASLRSNPLKHTGVVERTFVVVRASGCIAETCKCVIATYHVCGGHRSMPQL